MSVSLGEVRPDLARIRFGIGTLQMEFVDFALDLMQAIIEEEIIQPIKQQLRSESYSPKIIAEVRAEVKTRTDFKTITWLIISDFTTPKGFPVAVMIERGRKAYVIFPKPPSRERPNPALKIPTPDGDIFRKKVKMPRLPGNHIVFRTVRKKRNRVRKRFNTEANRFIKEVLLD